MDVKEVVIARRSIRAYHPEPISKEILEEIMEKALWAPSWGNTQTWGLLVVGGEALEKIRAESISEFMAGGPDRTDVAAPEQFNEAQMDRYRGLGRDLFAALGIGREDKERRMEYYYDMMRFFNAPYLVYLHLDRNFNQYAMFDAGIIMQTIALLAVEYGLGTCFIARSIVYPDVVRKHTGLSEDQALIMGLTLGRPVEDAPINRFERNRGAPEEMIKWVGVE